MQTAIKTATFSFCVYQLYKKTKQEYLFQPSKESKWKPYDNSVLFYETFLNNQLNVWYIPNGRITVLLCCDFKNNMSHCEDYIKKLLNSGVSVCCFDYQGFGKSKGISDEKSVIENAKTVYDYLLNYRNIPIENIIVYGISAGAYVANELDCGNIILETKGNELLKYFGVVRKIKQNKSNIVLVSDGCDLDILLYRKIPHSNKAILNQRRHEEDYKDILYYLSKMKKDNIQV
jgi:hypothetical protein